MKTSIQKLWMLIGMLWVSISAFGYDFTVDGIYYSVISLPDMTCKVVKGDEKYKGDIVIPTEVTFNNRKLLVMEIEEEAFYECKSLTSVNIGGAVRKIGDEAFYACRSLANVRIPKSVSMIGKSAFKGCWALTSVTIPNSVTEIGQSAFCGCGLTSITIPNSITEISSDAFNGCTDLACVTIPNSVTSIGGGAFKDCESLTSITIPNSVTEIGYEAFFQCSSLRSITIPNSVTEIGVEAFFNCVSLKSITIPNSVTEVGANAFLYCTSLESIILSDSMTEIYLGLFNNCYNLKEIVLPGSIQRIFQSTSGRDDNKGTFYNCKSLKNLSILNSTEKLSVGSGYYKEYNSSEWYSWTETIETLFIDRSLETAIPVPNLEKLELGESIQEVQVENISKLEKLKIIESHALVPPKIEKPSNAQYMTVNVYVPSEALDAYKTDPIWGQFWNLQASGVEDLKDDSNVKIETGRSDINGHAVSDDYDGLVIVKFSDGSYKKMFNRSK